MSCPFLVGNQGVASLTEEVKALAREMGFHPVGVAPAEPPAHFAFYQAWLSAGRAGEMAYLGRNMPRRADPREILPGARSILCVGLNYAPREEAEEPLVAPTGRVARYAYGDDYHDLMEGRLTDLLVRIREMDPSVDGKCYVDTGPVLERDIASRAGLGWFGKNTNLIHKRTGSWFFLGEIILTAALSPDAPAMDHCGTCRACLDACPTNAFPEAYVLDSTRCISYLTIELKGPIPLNLRPKMGDWVFGCDVCQEVCPWNLRHAKATQEVGFLPRPEAARPALRNLLGLSSDGFRRRFRGSPIKRIKRRGLLRNAAVALGNVGTAEDVPALAEALADAEPLVRGHAAWALGRIGGARARAALSEAVRTENDPYVRDELHAAMSALEDSE